MIYIATIIALLVLVVKYDFAPHSKTNKRDLWLRILMIWFICVSGFAYNVGSDIPGYMDEYDGALWSKIHSFADILMFDDQRQPGWIIVEFVCRAISPDFWLFKMVLAIFLNWTVFRFVKRHSPYPFMSILFYSIILYLHLNFNALRQATAAGFFLLGYDYIIDKKWVKYYIMAFMAYMFHSSALVLFVFPLLTLLKLNKKTILISVAVLVAVVAASLMSDLQEIAYNFFLFQGEAVSEDLIDKADLYLGDKAISGRDILNFNGIIFALIRTCIYFIVMILAIRSKEVKNKEDILFYLLFIVFFVLREFTVPIIFFRLLFYVQFLYVCLLPMAIMQVGRQFHEVKHLACAIMLMMFMYGPIKDLTRDTEKTGLPLMSQYAPYYSIFNPHIDPVRSAHFGSHR